MVFASCASMPDRWECRVQESLCVPAAAVVAEGDCTVALCHLQRADALADVLTRVSARVRARMDATIVYVGVVAAAV